MSSKKSLLDLKMLDTPLDVDDIISKYAKAAVIRQAADQEGAPPDLLSQHASHRTDAGKLMLVEMIRKVTLRGVDEEWMRLLHCKSLFH